MSNTELTDLSLYQAVARGPYEQVLACANEISQYYQRGDAATDDTALLAEQILANRELLLGSLPDYLHPESAYFSRTFVKSIYLWLLLPFSSGRSRYDSLGSRTHQRYSVDLPIAEGDWPMVETSLVAMGFSEALLQEVKGEVLAQSSNSEIKRLIADYLTAHLHATQDHVGLFQGIYGDVDIPADIVDVIITDAQIFLCVPYDNDGLIDADRYGWTSTHNQQFQQFLAALAMGSSTERVYFPSVGVFNREAVSAQLIDDITQYIQRQGGAFHHVSSHIVIETLGSMILLMASQEVEKFLIHDAWGHAWQETLCDFEWLYVKMGAFRRPLSALVPSMYSDAENDCLAAALRRDGANGLVIDVDAMDQWIRRDIQGRVTVALNACVAELTADIAEYKFAPVAQQHGLAFPSSSVLAPYIVRLDLTFSDAAKHITSLGMPYLTLATDDTNAQALREELLGDGYSPAEVEQVLATLVSHITTHYRGLLSIESQGSTLNLYEMMQINLCSIFCALHDYECNGAGLAQSASAPDVSGLVAQCPYPEHSLDFVTLAMACFFEEDRRKNIWHLDEILSGPLQTMIHRFGQQWRKGGRVRG